MLIKALCDYYDILAREGKTIVPGYSSVKISYLISLTPEGRVDALVDCRQKEQVPAGKDKWKERLIAQEMVMPERSNKSAIGASVTDHRPLYIFGLNSDKTAFSSQDKSNKAQKSHESFVKVNLDFIEGLHSPVIDAFRAFLQGWVPEEETENPFLLSIVKEYGASGFAFCLTGCPDETLHRDPQLVARWEKRCQSNRLQEQETVRAQCAVLGTQEPIARLHGKIKGIYGGQPTGNLLVCFNNDSEESYGREQSYNSNLSEEAARRYAEALNFLLASKKHRVILDDVTVVFFAMDKGEAYGDLLNTLLFGSADMDAGQTQDMLANLMEDAREGRVVAERIASTEKIDPNVDFYITGLKPNSARLAVKFLYHKRFGEVLQNIARHQSDMQLSPRPLPVPLWVIKKELLSPKGSNDTVDPALLSKLLESIFTGAPYPEWLLATVVRRVRTDLCGSANGLNRNRAGLIKACINRKQRFSEKKEEFNMSLDPQNHTPAYLCGRLFAALEKLQTDAAGGKLNRTIRDAYFSSASSTPSLVFPKLLRLAQAHLNKVKYPSYYNKLMGDIMDMLLEGEFPNHLRLEDQGRFIIGYYQQMESFFVKKQSEENQVMQEDE